MRRHLAPPVARRLDNLMHQRISSMSVSRLPSADGGIYVDIRLGERTGAILDRDQAVDLVNRISICAGLTGA